MLPPVCLSVRPSHVQWISINSRPSPNDKSCQPWKRVHSVKPPLNSNVMFWWWCTLYWWASRHLLVVSHSSLLFKLHTCKPAAQSTVVTRAHARACMWVCVQLCLGPNPFLRNLILPISYDGRPLPPGRQNFRIVARLRNAAANRLVCRSTLFVNLLLETLRWRISYTYLLNWQMQVMYQWPSQLWLRTWREAISTQLHSSRHLMTSLPVHSLRYHHCHHLMTSLRRPQNRRSRRRRLRRNSGESKSVLFYLFIMPILERGRALNDDDQPWASC